MDFLEPLTKIFSSLTGVMALVAIIILWKVGLLEFLLSMKKNGKNGNGHDIYKQFSERIDALETNHLHTLESIMQDVRQEMSELRRELNEHSKEEIRALDRILIHLEEKHE